MRTMGSPNKHLLSPCHVTDTVVDTKLKIESLYQLGLCVASYRKLAPNLISNSFGSCKWKFRGRVGFRIELIQ